MTRLPPSCRFVRLHALAAASALACAAGTQAQSVSTPTEEVVVTGSLTQQRVQDAPFAITVVDREAKYKAKKGDDLTTDDLPDGLVVADGAGRIVCFNAAAARITAARHDDYTLDAELIGSAIAEHDADVVIITTPNNPTGTAVGHQELRAFLAQVPPHVLVVIDEAYVHFQNDPDAARGLELYREFPNVAVLHTFSKAYGLAALRLGYTVARPEVMEGLAKVALPFGVTDIAQAAGVASLLAEPELQARIDVLLEERAKLEAYLATTDWDAPASQANFVWLAAGEETDALQAHLMSRGIIGRAFSGTGIRISVGSPEANEALVEALGSYNRG